MLGKNKAQTDDDEAPQKGGPVRMFIVGVISLLIAGGGYFIGGRDGAAATTPDATQQAAGAVPAGPVEPEIHEIVDLEAVNVNLTDNHYLRVAISLGIALAVDSEEASSAKAHGADAAEGSTFPTAPAADLVLSTYAVRSLAELSDPAGRAAARDELELRLKEYYGEEILVTVFFTEFVMQ